MSDIELKDVSFSYDGKSVLQNLSLVIEDGQGIAVVGASGGGKTTLLRLLAGLEKPQMGTISGLPEKVSMVFQEDRLIPSLTVTQNIWAAAGELAQSEIEAMLEGVGLSGEGDSYPSALSGGMKRRVAIVRMAACKRQLYLLDEPFKGLDPETKVQVMDFCKEATKGSTVVMVTHDISEAEYMGMKVARIGL